MKLVNAESCICVYLFLLSKSEDFIESVSSYNYTVLLLSFEIIISLVRVNTGNM